MAITVTLTVSPTNPGHGATVTATYAVSGNSAVSVPVTGNVNIGGTDYNVAATLTEPALAESYSAPVAAGLTFTATGDPHVWTAVVP